MSDGRGDRQTAYQILVSAAPETLAADVGDLWDSGLVVSETCEGVPYGGDPLASRGRYWWKVRLGDRDSAAGAWSEPVSFEMGLLESEAWLAVWVGAAAGVSSPLIRRDFDLPAAPRLARAYVSGLGYHELHLNGAKVGDHVLDPITTTYDRDPEFLYSDELHPRVLYVVHDIAGQLREGPNAIGLMLGHGWYSAEADVGTPPDHHKPYGDRPRALAQLEIELVTGDGRIVRSGALTMPRVTVKPSSSEMGEPIA